MRLTFSLLACALVACGTDRAGGDDAPPDGSIAPVEDDPLVGLPTGVDQWMALCAQHYGDMISAKFCAGTAPPKLSSLADLEALLGLTMVPNPNNSPNVNANVRATLVGESTGLGMRVVNSIVPRAFLMTPPVQGQPNPNYQVLSFARGEPLVELVANDPAAQTLRFFLIRFHPACEATGCTHADLQTPTIESNWTGYTIYDDVTIANTTLDCLSCHQPGGTSSRKLLRMQELQNSWAHWFYPERPATLQIVDDFENSHPTEDYAGIPYQLVRGTRPAVLMQIVQNNGFGTQPNAFDTNTINTELANGGTSQTWSTLYARAVAGTDIPVPYYSNPFDRVKQQAAITAYQQTMAGTLARDQMPDLRNTFLDAALPFMSIRPQPGLDGRGILAHMCRQCHNSRLDQSLSRARFNVETLDQMSRQEKDTAITRLQLPVTDRRAMPPARFHELSAAERQLVIDELLK